MLDDKDDELASLLADEDRVREVLLAAIDGQLVPPERTDVTQIVRRGKRRARLQVLAASAAAVVLIAAVALGASVLARWNGSNQVGTANGSATSLPVTSQSITTSPNPPSAPVYADDASQPTCLYPGLADGARKWIPLNVKQLNLFLSALSAFTGDPSMPVNPAAVTAIAKQGGTGSVESAAIYAHGQLNLVTISATAYTGAAETAAGLDSRQLNMPRACTGSYVPRPLGKMPLVNEYLVTPASDAAQTRYVRVQIYESSGIRYDVTEVVDPAGLSDPVVTKLMPAGRAAPPVTGVLPPALSATQLAGIALQVASFA